MANPIVRTRSKPLVNVVEDFDRYHCNPSCSVSSTYSFGTARRSEVMTDRITPGYHKIIREGGRLPVNKVTHSKVDASATIGDFTTRKGTFTGKGALDYGPIIGSLGHVYLDQADADSIRSQLRTEAIARAKSPSLDLGPLLAELRGTIDTYANATKRVNAHAEKLARKARKRSIKYRDRLNVFQDMWLEARYGWAPEVYTLVDAIEAMRRSSYVHNRGWAQQEVTVISTEVEELDWSTCDLEVHSTIESTHTYRFGAMGVYDWRLGTIGADPVQGLLEAIPYSFVAEWFLDIGSTLRAAIPSPRVHIAQGSAWYSHKVVSRFTDIHHVITSVTSGWSVNGYPNQVTGTISDYSRVPDFGSVSYIPHFRVDLDLKRLIDAYALTKKARLRIGEILAGLRR